MIMRTAFLTAMFLLSGQAAFTADLGNRFESFEAMHATPFGSLFFVEGVVHDWDIPSQPRFVLIQGEGQINLPVQQGGYCFAFNHYLSTGTLSVSRTYRARIRKTPAKGSTRLDLFSGEYIPTPDIASSAVPSLCINGIADVRLIEILFNSERTKDFNRAISFQIGSTTPP
ncbi:hypothetical protein [Bradyrhizobium amphicarpaeae]|uniref:Uncharacterized protein n=1 Tax=Bradyrhizobium amphicarpaeae TaxID=1404768 RepID=A0A2U8Q1E4_9BRAD|nr:hypothetical protein [Bradyrhizobium amphicarpaeae]AWM03729.1 hypothetical protein CIT40_29320 [Bradyrhizobium amphicarpaeae]